MLCTKAFSLFLFPGAAFTLRRDLFAPQFSRDFPPCPRRTPLSPILSTEFLKYCPSFFQRRTYELACRISFFSPVTPSVANLRLPQLFLVFFCLVEDLPKALRSPPSRNKCGEIFHLFDCSAREDPGQCFRSSLHDVVIADFWPGRSLKPHMGTSPICGDKCLCELHLVSSL